MEGGRGMDRMVWETEDDDREGQARYDTRYYSSGFSPEERGKVHPSGSAYPLLRNSARQGKQGPGAAQFSSSGFSPLSVLAKLSPVSVACPRHPILSFQHWLHTACPPLPFSSPLQWNHGFSILILLSALPHESPSRVLGWGCLSVL